MRTEIRKENGSYKNSIDEVDPHVYVNHTWLKKYSTPLIKTDSERENNVLYLRPGETLDNEWHITKDGIFEPGIISKKDEHYKKGIFRVKKMRLFSIKKL